MFVSGILQDYIKPFNRTRGLVYFVQDAPEPYFECAMPKNKIKDILMCFSWSDKMM